MKKIKTNIKHFLFSILFFGLYQNISAQTSGINGDLDITPGVDSQYSWYDFGCSSPIWSCANSNVSFMPSTTSNPNTVRVSKNITAPAIQINVTGACVEWIGNTQVNSTRVVSKLIEINPFLVGATTIHPGESITITNQDNRSGYSGHVACLWNWGCSDLSALFCGGGNCSNNINNTAVLNCPSSLPTAISNNGFYSVSCYKRCQLGAFQYLSQMNVNVKLHNPSISGLSSVGCGGEVTTNLIYTASPVTGATYYVWQVPSGWSITSGANTNAITVNTSGTNAGNVTVRAYALNGSAVKSDLISFPVGCCTTDMSITNNVNSGSTDHQQAANSINATNTINNGATAKYHAGNEVQLSSGFSAELGSDLHLYIEGCTGNYYRMISPENTNDEESNSDISEQLSDINISQAGNGTDQITNDINVYPNPNSGEFILTLNNDNELPRSIVVSDAYGKEIKIIREPKEYKYNFDLKNFDSGLYIINVFYSDKTMSKRIIKN